MLIFTGWATQMIPRFDGKDPLHLTDSQKGWVVEAMFVADLLGSVLPFFLINKFGLKRTLMLSLLPKILCWLVIGLASSYWLLLAGRFLAGTALSTCYVVLLYLGETINKRMRGIMGAIVSVSMSLGILSAFTAGIWLDREKFSYVMVSVPLIFLVGSFWLPNSPTYLIKNNQEKKAKEILQLLGEENVNRRFEEIRRTLEEESKATTRMEFLKKPRSVRAFYLAAILIISDFGYSPSITYESYIFQKSQMNVDLMIVLSGLLPMVPSFLFLAIVKYTGKRKIILLSLMIVSISHLVIAAYFTLELIDIDTSAYRWVPTIFALIYVTNGVSGVYSMTMCYLGEIFPYEVKPVAALYCTVINALVNAVGVKLHEVSFFFMNLFPAMDNNI